jgi:Icc-related predicted phosphoesterase
VPAKKSGAVRFCAVSDTHEVEHLLEIPPCDVLLHCGDVSFQNGDGDGEFYAQRVNEWFGSLKDIQHKVVIGGNHDRFLQSLDMEHKRKLFSNAIYLENNSVEITSSGRKIRIHGSPISISGKSQNTGFQYARDSSSGADLIKKVIPESGIDILMTHGMPYGKCDGKTVSHGCKMLAARVEQLQPLVHVFGHRHQSYSADFSETGNTTYINAASLAASRLPEHPPVVFDLFIK